MRVRAGLTALVTVIVAVGVACTSGGGARSSGAVTTTTAQHHAAAPVAADASAAEVRGRFEQLLGQHALLAVRLTRSEVAKDQELRGATEASLRANADALGQLVGVAFDGAQADRFRRLWDGYTGELTAYATGVAGGDAEASQEARTALLDHCADWGAWVAEASGGRVAAGDAERTAQARVEQLMGQVDAYAERNYDRAYRIERQTYQRTFAAGTTLAKASATPKEAAALDAAPEKLRSAFAMLLGEHMELIVDAQQATFAGSPEFQAAAAQLNANTETLAKAMGAIVGPARAAEFQTAWANHVEGLMAYTAAVASKDQAAQAVAKENLDGFAERLALYFSDIVRNVLATEPLTEAITAHDAHLINHVDAFAVRDYAKAQQMQDEGYQQMLGVANTLVDAIQKTVQPRQPAGGSQTGGGGAAHVHSSP